MNRIDRLFGILLRLQRGRVRAQDLARRFEVSERTIYRDITALNELGVPIISLPHVGYELPGGFSLPPLFFTSDEAASAALAVQLLLAQTSGTTSRNAEQALAKIIAVLPHELRQRVDELSAIIRFYAAEQPFDLDDPRLVQLQHAISERQVVVLRYQSYRHEEATAREVEPETLTYYKGAWYLSGYCRLRRGWRSFRLDRIDELRVGDEQFVPHVNTVVVEKQIVVRIRFTPSLARWVRERQHFGYAADETGDIMCYEVSDPQAMLPWILSWGAGAEVLEPASLRATVRAEIAKLLEILT